MVGVFNADIQLLDPPCLLPIKHQHPPAMQVQRETQIPLYRQIKDHLDEMILAGGALPGSRLPSEKELQDQLGVSRITVRQAMQQLEAEGKVVRVPGKGTFVLAPKVEPLAGLTSFSENMRAWGLDPSYRDSRTEWVEPEKKIHEALKLGDLEKVLYIYRLLLADGIPMAIQHAFLPGSLFGESRDLFTPARLDARSMYELIEHDIGVKLASAEELVEASVATRDEAKTLDIAPGNLVLVITRLTRNEAKVPVEYVKLIFRADRYRYRVELSRPSTGLARYQEGRKGKEVRT